MPRSRPIDLHRANVTTENDVTTENAPSKKLGAEVSIRWRGVVDSGWKRINKGSFSCI